MTSIESNKNCSKFNSNNKFVLDSQTNLKDDVCNETGDNVQNTNINNWVLSNYASCECNLDNVMEASLNNNGIIIKDGYGVSECNVEKDTTLRVGNVERHYKSDLQLFPRPFLTTPSTIKGKYKSNLESKLISSIITNKHRQMQNVNQDNVYTPLVPNLSRNIQNPIHIIPEDVRNDWPRGGISTTEFERFKDWKKTSTDTPEIKSALYEKLSYFNLK